jgi:hypothetical protein
MKLSKIGLMSVVLFMGSTIHLQAEFISVMELTDLRGNTAYKICTEEEKKKLDLELRAEAKAYSKALELTKTQWNTMYKGDAFPSSRIKQRTMRVMTTTSKQEEADLFVSKMETEEARQISKDRAEEEQILKKKPQPARRGRSSNSSSIKRQQEEVKEDRQKDAHADKAEDLLRKNLTTLAGHEVPFFGDVPVKKQAKAAAKKK